MIGECQACGEVKPLDLCHIKSKGAGGLLNETNTYLACRICHQKQHKLGFVTFVKLFPRMEKILSDKGWHFETIFGRTKLARK